MTSAVQLEFKGDLAKHPLPELLAEFSQKAFSGSLRLSDGDKKAVVYFEDGQVVFAVSNARNHRLFSILLEQGQLQKSQLAGIEEFTNDMHLARSLVENKIFTQQAIDAMFGFQILAILKEAANWKKDEFVFSASARIKSGIKFSVDLKNYFEEYCAVLSDADIVERFHSLDEKFGLNPAADLTGVQMSPEHAFAVSRLGIEPVSADILRSMCGLDSNQLLPLLYRLWIGGYITRNGWQEAVDKENSERLGATKFELKTAARSFEDDLAKANQEAAELAEKEKAELEAENAVDEVLTVEKYLENIENAATHYEIFAISPDAKLPAIKQAYFNLAKQFHPDLFYRKVDDAIHKQIQHAFTEIAQAYETLKNEESREVYDFKLRKVIEQMRQAETRELLDIDEPPSDLTGQDRMAQENFDAGYDLLLKDNIEKALPYLARAVHMDDTSARFHAFYGRALTFDADNLRKAEAELQTALRIEPTNIQFRFMLAQLYVEIGHKVRVKAEVNRILEAQPNHQEARSLLDSLDD